MPPDHQMKPAVSRFLFPDVRSVIAVVGLCSCLGSMTFAQSKTSPDSSTPLDALTLEDLGRDAISEPENAETIALYGEAVRKEFVGARLISTEQARNVIAIASSVVEEIAPSSEEAATRLTDLKRNLAFYKRLLDAHEIPIETLEESLLRDPNDFETFLIYEIKFQIEDERFYEAESPEEAVNRLDHVAEVLGRISSNTTKTNISEECAVLIERIHGFHKRRIESARFRLSAIGKPAVFPSETICTWIDENPPKDNSLEGKVVLLDFWALSCGPCIAGLPKVNRWHDKYSTQGLVVIAVTELETSAIDGDRESTLASDGEPQLDRIKSLFRDKNLGIQSFLDHGQLHEAYHVEGVPHYAIVDRLGTIQMVRTGNNIDSLDNMETEIVTLLQQPARLETHPNKRMHAEPPGKRNLTDNHPR